MSKWVKYRNICRHLQTSTDVQMDTVRVCVLQWAKLDHTLYRKRVSSFTFSECPISMSRRSQATVQPSDMLLLMDAMTGQNVQCLDKLGGFESF